MLSAVIACGRAARAENVAGSGAAQQAPSTAPTTSDGDAQTLPATGVIDDTDKAWVWSGMESYSDTKLHGGTGHAGGPGTYGTYTFHGTAVDVIGLAAPSIVVGTQTHPIGKASIVLDGKQVELSTMTADTPQYASTIAHLTGLTDGNHVVEIHAVDGWIVVDYIQATLTPAGYSGPCLIPEGNYVLTPKNAASLMLGTTDWRDGTGASLCPPSHEAPVVWHFTPLGPRLYEISLAAVPGQVLSVLTATDADGCPRYPRVGVWKDVGNPKQRWTVTLLDAGYIFITVSDDPRSAVNICNWGSTVGSEIQAYPHDQGDAGAHDSCEQWFLTAVK